MESIRDVFRVLYILWHGMALIVIPTVYIAVLYVLNRLGIKIPKVFHIAGIFIVAWACAGVIIHAVLNFFLP